MMEHGVRKKSSFKAGMYLLETLTSGMYNDPLSIYREYIQNAVDSIDIGKLNQRSKIVQATITIDLDPLKRTITIRDNGVGIPAEIAENILSSIGSSNKQGNRQRELRGFRGIGRLGGIAFSDKAIFRTKADGEKTESIQEWDCKKLRQLFDTEKYNLTLKQLFRAITHFSKRNGLPSKGSYFEIILCNVSSFRNQIFDIAKIRNYISQVAPVPFNYDQFSYGRLIDEYLINKVPNHGMYNIILNGTPIHKSYSDTIKTAMKRDVTDHIENIHFFNIKRNEEIPIAYGWYGIRHNLLGSIRKGESYSGVRVRVGNILLGDAHLLDRCFREDRFNSYMVGEIHAATSLLVPNSRRDDFIDSGTKTIFYNAFEKEIGLPISKEIRHRSRIRSQSANSFDNKFNEPEFEEYKKSNDSCLISDDQSGHNLSMARLNKIKMLCQGCPKLPKILSGISEAL